MMTIITIRRLATYLLIIGLILYLILLPSSSNLLTADVSSFASSGQKQQEEEEQQQKEGHHHQQQRQQLHQHRSGVGGSGGSGGSGTRVVWLEDAHDHFGDGDFDSNKTNVTGTGTAAVVQLNKRPDWFDDGWLWRKPIYINNVGNQETLYDFQIYITINYESGMNSDFTDLRFTDSDGITLISYFFEEVVDADYVNIWIKVPEIPADSTKTIYMYYNNQSISNSLSDPDATFEFYDDFTTDPELSGKWNIYRYVDDPTSEAHWESDMWFLTTALPNRAVAVFTDYQLTITRWQAHFKYCITGGSTVGGEGMTFMFYKDETAYYAPEKPAVGAQLGFTNGNPVLGYGIELDSVLNSSIDEADDHLAIIEDVVSNHLTTVETTAVETTTFYDMIVTFVDGEVTIEIPDAGVTHEHTISSPLYTYAGVGFSASTSTLHTNNHILYGPFYIRKYTTHNLAPTLGEIEYQYYSEAYYYSHVEDTGGTSTHINSISWDATIPSGTSIEIEYRASNYNYPITSPEPSWEPLESNPDTTISSTGRYIQYRVKFTGGETTPSLDWIEINYNSPPILFDGNVTPSSGDTATVFTYRVTYKDPEGSLPTIKRVYIDGVAYEMVYEGTNPDGYPIYKNETTLSVGDHNFYFLFADDLNQQTKLPDIGTFPGPGVTELNHPPMLIWTGEPGYVADGVEPDKGTTTTTFEFRVKYIDEDNNDPTVGDGYVVVYIDGVPYKMTPTDTHWSVGVVFTYQTELEAGAHTYYFECSDGYGGIDCLPFPPPKAGPQVNFKPELQEPTVTPDPGVVDDYFAYRVIYKDLDNEAPTVKNVYINGIAHPMSVDVYTADPTLKNGDYTDGELYVFTTELEVGTHHTYRFEFSDGFELTTTAELPGPIVLVDWPNLEVSPSDIRFEFKSGSLPTTVKIFVTVHNRGLGDASNFKIEFCYDEPPPSDPEEPIDPLYHLGTCSVSEGLRAGKSVTRSILWELPDFVTNYTIYVAVDRADQVKETIEYSATNTDNLGIKILHVGADLEPIRIFPPAGIAYREFVINISIRNHGAIDAEPPPPAKITVGVIFPDTPVPRELIYTLIPGETTVYGTVTWLSGPGEYMIRVIVDLDNNVTEYNEGNNEHIIILTVVEPKHISRSITLDFGALLLILIFISGLVARLKIKR